LFRFAILSFFLNHALYIVAFFLLGVNFVAASYALIALIVALWFIWQYIENGVPNDLRIPVLAYCGLIGIMVACAYGCFRVAIVDSDHARARLLWGALLFFVSDLFVARNRFVREHIENRIIGITLYFLGQFVFAYYIGFSVESK
jgi:uncharacterized membrane protein YhhN